MIIQLSDLHIKQNGRLAYQKIDTLTALRRAVAYINAMIPIPEHIIISGDLADFGTADEYKLIAECLETLRFPLSIVPGNHDSRRPLRQYLAPLSNFAHEHYCTFYHQTSDWVWIGLDSLVEGQHHGFIERAQLDWLETQLQKQPDLPHILCWHHPPIRVGIEHMDTNNLRNAEEVGEVLAHYRQIQGIVCGHVHRPISANWQGKTVWIAPAINHSVSLNLTANARSSFTIEPPAIRLFQGHGNAIVSHLSYINEAHKDGPYPFFDAQGQLID